MEISTSEGRFPLPSPFDCEKPHGVAVIYPNGCFNRQSRKAIDRHKFSYSILEADPFEESHAGYSPADFNETTLSWAIRRATLIVLWGGMIPFDQGAFTQLLRKHARRGGRIAIALIRDAKREEWLRFIAENVTSGRTELLVIQGKWQSSQTSGAVH